MANDFDQALAEAAERMGISRRDVESLREDVRRQHAQGHNEQREIARQGQEARHVDGLGEKRLQVSTQLYVDAQQRYGRDCWKDPDFVKKVQRDHPETRVNSRSGKTMVGYGS